MEPDDATRLWLPLVGSTIFIYLLSTLPLPLLALIPVLAAITYAMQAQVYHTRTLAREFWIAIYLRDGSPIRRFLVGTSLLRWIAVGASIPLAVITYIVVYSYDVWDCIAVAAGIYSARVVHTQLAKPIDANVADNLTELARIRVHYWLAIFAVILSLIVSSVAKGISSDYSQATSDQIATHVIDSVKHPVKIIESCVRTLKYFDMQLLRVRDINRRPYGWLIYAFFLLPNALPAYGLVTLYSGVERIANATLRK